MEPADFLAFVESRSEQIKDERYLADRRTALLCAVIANSAPRKNAGKKYKVEDFMPRQKKKHQTEEEMLKTVERLNKMFGGTDTRKRGGIDGRDTGS